MREFIILFIFIPILGLGQDFNLSLFEPSKHLPTEPIKSVIQDSRGFMLLLTQRGIYRFDGVSSKLLISQVSLKDAHLFYKTNNHKIIILSKQGLYELNETNQNPATIELKLLIQCNNPIQIHQEDTHTLWISLSSGEILQYHQQKTSNYPFENDRNQKHFLINKTKVIGLISAKGLVYRFKDKNFYTDYQIATDRVKTVLAYQENVYWLATQRGIVILNLSNPAKTLSQQIANAPRGVTSFCSFNKDIIILGTQNQGLYQVNTSFKELKFLPFEHSTGLHLSEVPDFHQIKQIYLDRERGIWVFQEKGLAYFKAKLFSSPHKTLASYQTNSTCQTTNGDMYFASNNEVFRMYRTTSHYEVESVIRISEGAINTIEAQGDKVWVGVVNGLLICLQNGKPIFTLNLTKRGGSIFSIYPDHKKRVWFCQVAQENPLPGLSYIAEDQSVKYYGTSKGIRGRILTMKESSKQKLFLGGIGSQTYLYVMDEKKDKFINLSLPLPFDVQHFEVHDLVIDKEDNVWLATNQGLLKYFSREKKIIRINLGELMTTAEMRAILIDRQNKIWVSTDFFGLICYYKGQYSVYTTQNGLSNRVLWYRHIFLDQESRLWVGASDDVVVASEIINYPRKTPPPILMNMKINQQTIPLYYHIFNFNLPFKAYWELSFRSPSYPSHSIVYQYRFKGQNMQWSGSQSSNSLIFNNLSSGTHLLEIRAKQTAYDWSEALTIQVIIEPAWYKRWWAFFLYALILMFIMWGLIKMNSWRLEQDKKRLNQIIAQKTRQLSLKNELLVQNHLELLALNDEIKAQNEELHHQAEELSTQRDFIEEKNKEIMLKKEELSAINKNLDKLVKQRTRKIKELNIKIINYAFHNAHKVRGPLARILGLLTVIELENDPQMISTYLNLIKTNAQQLDEIIKDINATLSTEKANLLLKRNNRK